MNAHTYTMTGEKVAKATVLDATVFGVVPTNHDLLKLAYNSYLANSRANLAVTKTRADVSGGGKKPWKQKGTGRARFGSSRVPQWRHGGIVFGPTGNENYTLTVPVKAKRTALRQALSMAAAEGRIRVLEAFQTTDGKAAPVAAFLKKIEVSGRTLVVVDAKDDMTLRATRNLTNIHLVSARYLNVFHLINADTILISQSALAIVSDWLGTATPTAAKGDKS